MSDLTHGFSDTQLNDHSASDTIERVLEEASLDGPLKDCLLDGFKSEVRKNDLAKFEEVLRASLSKGTTAEEQLAHFIQHCPYERRLFKRGDEFRDKLKDAIENGSDEEYRQLYRVILPTPLGIAVKTHIFRSRPLHFLHFSIGLKQLYRHDYEVALELYGDSPFELLVRAWLELSNADRESIPRFAPVALLDECWDWQRFATKTLESYTEYLRRLAFYHEQLIGAGWLAEAKGLAYHRPSGFDRKTDRAWGDAERYCWSLMDWQRLRAEKFKSNDDCKEFLMLSIYLRKSFLESDCETDLLDVYIRDSLQVLLEVIQQGRVERDYPVDVFNQYGVERSLHERWCYSPHQAQWFVALELKLREIEDASELHVLKYLLERTGKCYIRLQDNLNDVQLVDDESSQEEVEFELPGREAWLLELQRIQAAFLERKLHLEVAEVADLLEIICHRTMRDFAELTVKLQVADRLLAQIWLFPGADPTLSDIDKSYQAQRLLITHEPEKLLRILIQAFRKSQEPCSGEKLEYGAGSSLSGIENSENPVHWFLSVIISNCLRLPYARQQKRMFSSNSKVFSDEEVEEVTYSLRKTMAEYCWKSLRLRKGETCESNRYQNAQCTEPNPIWRQAYAKALSEIGLDLGGSVHKTLNFIRKNDPNESVCAAAADAYKSVRRQKNSDESDPIKGLLIAFWWLRLGQRTAMSLDVDPSSATRTRRDELRYADRVDSVINMILS
ncbi:MULTISPECIES: hypothetical protein [unclassified Lentimonas]|uniref:hypothetical protein n=1 Tax=unclassified Lentimonas TaxID=2630993 RepID=UPI0013299EF1|nr:MULTISPECIES: hypothetical protein [unclassified Lentimonas]CAA6677360.1 Unannotated [Lentimonas sp. CC4]CAA6686905.1 Unannotated [Lentimonas sp. CC6]CAA6690088.1 Unannotated [Lentimonas sp. CC19]CAA6690958.1 Unannotated [Lentimonas sp. CC10]CAA7070698.1 Unannotated [Lentimonas sp. CC11]